MRRSKKSKFYIYLVGLLFIAFILVYTGSANEINEWIHGDKLSNNDESSSTDQLNASSRIIPVSQLDSYLKNNSNNGNTEEYDYSLMHTSTNNYDLSIDNIQIKSFNYLNPDYLDYSSMEYRSSNDGIQEINPQPKYIQRPLTLCNFKIENTCNNYIDPFLNRAAIVYDNGTQENTLCGNSMGFENYEFNQISQYIIMSNIPSLAPNATGHFTLVFKNIDMLENPVMTLEIISSSRIDTIRIPITDN